MLESLHVKIDRSVEPTVLIVRLSGSLLSRDDGDKLFTLLNDALESASYVIMDLKDLRFMNSEGLSALLKLFTRIRRDGGEMAICGINDILKQLFLITRLVQIFKVFDGEADALAWLKNVQQNSSPQTSA